MDTSIDPYLHFFDVHLMDSILIYSSSFSHHQRNLYNAWVSTSKLRHSVRSKGIELQTLRLNLKLYSILKEQVRLLPDL